MQLKRNYQGKRPMLVRYWQPWKDMELMRRQLDRLFDELGHTQPVATLWRPAIELKEDDDQIVLRVELPGMAAKDLDVQVTREAVVISGEHRHEQQTEEKGVMKSEFRYGQFRRVVPLPAAVQNDKVAAEYKDGILSLTLPKVEEAKNKVVKINLAEPSAA